MSSAPSAKIKDIYIELNNYKFLHSAYDSDKGHKSRFIGRKKVEGRIKLLLKESINSSGTYLLTGFRGMGKTSILRRAISELNEENSSENSTKFTKLVTLVFKRSAWTFFVFFSTFLLLKGFTFSFFYLLVFLLPYTLMLVIFIVWHKKRSKSTQNQLSSIPLALDWLWTVIKFLTIIIPSFLLSYYWLDPIGYCKRWDCLSNSYNYIPHLQDAPWYLRLGIAIFLAYLLLAVVFLIHDFLYNIVYSSLYQRKSSKPTKFHSFEINLSQENISEREILKRMVDKVYDYWIKHEPKINTTTFNRPIYTPLQWIVQNVIPSKFRRTNNFKEIKDRCHVLSSKISGMVSQTTENGINPKMSTGLSGSIAKLTLPIGKITDRKTVQYPIASAKEIEDELVAILKKIEVIRIEENKPIPRFVFVIDELDKIEPQSSSLIDEREFSNPSLDESANIPGSREYRKRQEAVAKLLANLKGFLNVAEAKFFFIGGRELFDADQADIADRDSFYSSIFDDVIYVDSFYRDRLKGPKKSGISRMTEVFLVNFILNLYANDHKSIDTDELSLKRMFERMYLIDTNLVYSTIPGSKANVYTKEAFKLFQTLQNYIIYLTYRSNGSPKKLISLIENNISEVVLYKDKKMDLKSIKNSVIANNTFLFNHTTIDKYNGLKTDEPRQVKSLFLKLGYHTQYEINLTTDIYRPYLISNSRFMSDLGDKLLFATPFIFDHIIKFYPHGFSWRNLELIPEVVLVNKEPHLRSHIKSILSYLSQYHIKDAISGLYDYKYHSIVRKELSILSKLSDLSAAAFNFTLDESLLIKRHYKKKLIELREKYKNYQTLPGDNHFVHSICFVQSILGSLYFYDQEYDEAILYLTESIQTLRLPNAIDGRHITRHQFLLWLRNKLMIGLTLEKIQAYDSAVSMYRTLTIDTGRYLDRIVQYDSTMFEEVTIEQTKRNLKTSIKNNRIKLISDQRSEDHRNLHLITLPFVALLSALEKNRSDGVDYFNLYQNKNEFFKVLTPIYTQEEQQHKIGIDEYRKGYLKADYFNNVGSLLYYKNCQFTRFFTPNVWETNPFKDDVIRYARSEFEGEEQAEFDENYFIQNDHIVFFDVLHKQYNRLDKSERHRDYYPSLTAICFYWESLSELTKYHKSRINIGLKKLYEIENIELNPIQLSACYLMGNFIDMISAKRFYNIANIVSKIADACFASLNTSNIDGNELYTELNGFVNYKYLDILRDRDRFPKNYIDFIIKNLREEEMFNVSGILRLYILASELYRKSSSNYYYSFGLKKILYLIKDSISHIEENSDLTNIVKLCEDLCIDIIRASSWYNHISNRSQINKYRDLFNKNDVADSVFNTIIYNSSSNHSDAMEAILTVEMIKLKVKRRDPQKGNLYPTYIIDQNIIVRNKYIRLIELKYHQECIYSKYGFKTGMNWMHVVYDSIIVANTRWTFQNYIDTNKSRPLVKSDQDLYDKINKKEKEFAKSIEKLIVNQKEFESDLIDVFFALRESIKIIQMYEPGYIIGYSYLAESHKRAGEWCQFYRNYQKYLLRQNPSRDTKELDHKIKNVLGESSYLMLEVNYQYEVAIQNYHKVLQMHSEGRAYKDKLSDLYMLEDSYNDNLTHFNIAMERCRVNTGDIRNKIDTLQARISGIENETNKSSIYKYENYTSS